MSNLIDRRAAIDHWRFIIDATDDGDRYDMGFVDGLEFCISDLSTMPSAQQDTDEWCTDCKEYDHERNCCPRWSRVILETLKGAQLEVIRCKDCKHRDPEDRKCDCGHDILWQLPRQDDWYCADAERRTDG